MPAAVPDFVGSDFSSSPPGHRYRLYYSGWWTKEVDERRIEDLEKRIRGQAAGSRQVRNLLAQVRKLRGHLQTTGDFTEKHDQENLSCLRDIAELSPGFERQAQALRERQSRLLAGLPEASYLCVAALTTSPLAVGTGVEHPIENGLLFFDPHGLPYVPGSTLKGMLRRAAEELALFEANANGWTLGLVWWFLGLDPTASYLDPKGQAESTWCEAYREHVQRHVGAQPSVTFAWIASLPAVRERMETLRCDLRGFLLGLQGASEEARRNRDALRVQGTWQCWDAFFSPPRMRVEITNVHFKDYYQQGNAPHETGSPTPVYFLAVDAGVEVAFIVRNAERRGELGAPPHSDWKGLAQSALERVFLQLGIGAKSSVGYGRFEMTGANVTGVAGQGVSAHTAGPAPLAPDTRAQSVEAGAVWTCTVVYKPNTRTLEVQHENQKASASEQETKALLESCPQEIRDALLVRRKARARVRVVRLGKGFRIEALERAS